MALGVIGLCDARPADALLKVVAQCIEVFHSQKLPGRSKVGLDVLRDHAIVELRANFLPVLANAWNTSAEYTLSSECTTLW